jgi:predicted secreted hydrolase
MNARRTLATVLALLAWMTTGAQGLGQGFAGLGTDVQGFAVPQKGKPLVFPKDHGPHADYRIEWWYVTANLIAADGRRFGAQWTLFRSALKPGDAATWSDPQIWIGHAALTTGEHHYVAERLARGGVGQAGVETTPFAAWIDDWRMDGGEDKSGDPLDHIGISATAKAFSYKLNLAAKGPLVLQGDAGYSVKSMAGQASHYYSQPFYGVEGEVVMDGAPVKVTGQAWLDREWSSQPLAADQTGWDWFSLHLGSGEKLMAFRLRDGGAGFTSANWISADGKTQPLASGDIKFEPLRTAKVAGRDVPVAWRVRIPGKGLDITTQPLNEQSWMATSTPYWEGPISFTGSETGVGYLEMTGY